MGDAPQERALVETEVEARDQPGGGNLRRLKALPAELFMFDQADLDFGIYRIMNLRREEIRRFLDEGLLPRVRDARVHFKLVETSAETNNNRLKNGNDRG